MKGPAATMAAETIVVFGSDSDFRLSHVASDEANVAESASARIIFSPQSQPSASAFSRRHEDHEVIGAASPNFVTFVAS